MIIHRERTGNMARPTLPAMAFAHHPETHELIILRRGQMGYEVSRQQGVRAIDCNAGLDPPVTKAQAAAMLAGSMFGWHTPASDPANYDAEGEPVRGSNIIR